MTDKSIGRERTEITVGLEGYRRIDLQQHVDPVSLGLETGDHFVAELGSDGTPDGTLAGINVLRVTLTARTNPIYTECGAYIPCLVITNMADDLLPAKVDRPLVAFENYGDRTAIPVTRLTGGVVPLGLSELIKPADNPRALADSHLGVEMTYPDGGQPKDANVIRLSSLTNGPGWLTQVVVQADHIIEE